MTRREKLVADVLGGRADANIDFDDLRGLLLSFGFDERTKGSHHLFRKSGIEEPQSAARWAKCQAVSSETGPGSDLEAQPGGKRRMTNRYEIIIFWSDEDQAFIADAPELPGCMAHGTSHADALTNAQDAITLWLETAREHGDPVPEAKGRRLLYA